MTSSIWLRSERSDSPWLIHHTLSAVDAGPARKCVLGFAVFVTLLTATSIHLDAARCIDKDAFMLFIWLFCGSGSRNGSCSRVSPLAGMLVFQAEHNILMHPFHMSWRTYHRSGSVNVFVSLGSRGSDSTRCRLQASTGTRSIGIAHHHLAVGVVTTWAFYGPTGPEAIN